MDSERLFTLYQKEREYQKRVFGNYENIEVLNLSSFLLFHREYLRKAEHAYVQRWNTDLPPWLANCREFEIQGAAPVNVYKEIIKNFTLHGAVLEAFTEINPSMWRFGESINLKWK